MSARDRQRILPFSEFVRERQSECDEIVEARNTAQNINDSLPVLLTFRRMEIRQWSDRSAVGLYREQWTGMKLVLHRGSLWGFERRR